MMQIGTALMPIDLAQLQGGIPIVLGTIAIAGTQATKPAQAICVTGITAAILQILPAQALEQSV